ncbi:MAG: hypothetical protein R3223_11495, partial [Longimicrobiales bacterium]|nr:hypothetical protein [Longimicrobiales bacterium]
GLTPGFAALSAQEVDDPLSPPGRLRIGVAPSLTTWESRFGSRLEGGQRIEEVEPLGFDLSYDPLGAEGFPAIASLRESLREATGDPSLMLSLGRTRARLQARTIRIPVQVDLGITDWLTVGATVPFLKQRTEVGFIHSADTTNADLGLTPATGPGTSTELFLQDVSQAVAEMQSQADATCSADPGSPECQSAQSAAQDGQLFLDGVSAGYAMPLFPFQDSGAGGALRTRLADLDSRFQNHGVTSLPPPDAMPLAAGPLSQQDYQGVLAQSAFGVSASPLTTWQSPWEIGDVEVHGALRLLEGRRPEAEGWGLGSWLLGVGGLARFGTGRIDEPDDFLDRGAGDGQMDLEGRVFGDVTLARRLGLWADVRYGIQMEGTVPRRISPPEVGFPPVAHRADVTWDPGDYLDLEVAPRIRLTPDLALAARYRYFTKQSDGYGLAAGASPGAGVPPVNVLEAETSQTLHETGISVVYSTLRAVRAGRSGRPFEVRVRYRLAVGGSGGQTPKASRMEVGARFFWNLWGE